MVTVVVAYRVVKCFGLQVNGSPRTGRAVLQEQHE